MADHQKVHPIAGAHDEHRLDVNQSPELPPTVPLFPRGTSKSDNSDHHDGTEQYPPFRRKIPVMHTKPPQKRRSCCCRFFCWTLSFLLGLILVVAVVLGILYLVFRPKLPNYSIDSLLITQFNLTNNSNSLNATFDVAITARNPNKKIGIYYEGGSHISVWYTATNLCQGSLPKFYQGHRNTTVLNVTLSGQTDDASNLITSLQQQQNQNGFIPLNLKAKQPVRIKLGKLKLMKVNFRVRCKIDVDSLGATNNVINIKNSSCKFRFRL